MSIFNLLENINKKTAYTKPQKFVDIKRSSTNVQFIKKGHPLYDATVSQENDEIYLLAPNNTAYNETSLLHKFVAIVTYNNQNYLLINSTKHFKEQNIGLLMQFDENIYKIIPFTETEDNYQTDDEYTYNETYEYDHPIENYAFTASHNNSTTKLTYEKGKLPLTVQMIDEKRTLFSAKLSKFDIELIDYVIIPALQAFENK